MRQSDGMNLAPGASNPRPWRRMGSALIVLIAVMFALGMFIDPKNHPGKYLIYWSIILLLVVWLCALAIRDILFTRRLIAEWKAERKTELAEQMRRQREGEDG